MHFSRVCAIKQLLRVKQKIDEICIGYVAVALLGIVQYSGNVEASSSVVTGHTVKLFNCIL